MIFNRISGNKAAFTLAETLIALVIVGVVAAMTVPSLILVHQKEEILGKVKKTYGALQNTTNLAIVDYGPTTTWPMLSGSSRNTAKDFSERYIMPYLSTADVCANNNTTKCNYKIYALNKTVYNMPTNTFRFYLQDGTFIIVYADSNGNDSSARIFFDINGPKKPNIIGHDIFKIEYWIRSTSSARASQIGRVAPAYFNKNRTQIISNGNNEYCHKQKQGMACLSLLLKDSWVFSDDYPW